MGRPKSFESAEVIEAAKQSFWQRGFAGASLEQLEDSTGLGRSSLYHAFHSKRGLFDAVVEEYMQTVTARFLAPVEAPNATPEGAARTFRSLADWFREPGAERGCLMVNAIAELGGKGTDFAPHASAFLERVEAGFANALGVGSGQTRGVRSEGAERVALLTSAFLGVWLAVRVDPEAAAAMCESIAKEVDGWTSEQT